MHSLHILFAMTALAAPLGGVSAMQAAPPAPAPASAAPPAAAAAPAPTAPGDVIRCRSQPVQGSLVRHERICRTMREWRRLAQGGEDNARDIVGSGLICAGQGRTCGGD